MANITIYPPIIDGILPAFIKNEKGEGQLIVPFTFNAATTQGDYTSAVIKVKTIQEDVVITQAETDTIDLNESWAVFDLTEPVGDGNKTLGDFFEIGAHYKIQLALKNDVTIGWFSSVGVIKCTSQPKVTVFGGGGESAVELDENYGNQNYPYFIGVYSQGDGSEDTSSYFYDTNERIYSSYFELYTKDEDNNKILVEKSEEVIHNGTLDTDINEAREEWYPSIDLNSGENYYIKFHVTTVNNLQCASVGYPVFATEAIPLDIPADLEVDYDEENGVADLYFKAHSPSARATGRFVISRKDINLDNNWRIVYKFSLATELPDGLIWRDFTVEQGATYSYAIQQFNESNVYTGRKIFTYYNENGFPQEELTIKFDHMYLFDGEKQLKIKFNPKVSSFKTQIFEAKVDTIGSKYPFFLRNAMVAYKTFPISGLISMLMDDDELFTSYDSIERPYRNQTREKTPNRVSSLYNYTETDLSWKNIESERLFKLKVLDWLNDGKLKLFRSPQEGNYLVRLMENSLTPTDSLGRMIHTFNSTAYEADDVSYNTLVKHKIISIPTSLNTMSQKVKTVQLKNYAVYDNNHKLTGVEDILRYSVEIEIGETKVPKWFSRYEGPITRIDLRDILPGTQFKVIFSKDRERIITIGKTGAYTVKDINPIQGLQILLPEKSGNYEIPFKTGTVYTNIYERVLKGDAQIYYQATSTTGFDSISGEKVDPQACAQILDSPTNFPNNLSNIAERPVKINLLNVHKKDIVNLYVTLTKDGTLPDPFGSISLTNEENYMPDNAKPLLYFDRDCRYQVFKDKNSEYNLVPNALYNIRFVRPEHLPLDHGVERVVIPEKQDPNAEMADVGGLGQTSTVTQRESADAFYVSRQEKMDNIDRLSGDLFWQNDLYYEETKDSENVYYENLLDYLYDARTNKLIKKEDWDPSFTIVTKRQSTKIDLREIENYKLKELIPNKDFVSISFGNGVYADCFYQNLHLTYVFQNQASKYFKSDAYEATIDYEKALNNWTPSNPSTEDIELKKENLVNTLQGYYDQWISLEEE